LGNYLVFLTVGVLFYTGMMIAGFVDVFHDGAHQDISHAAWLVLAIVNAALSVVPYFLWHFVVRKYKAHTGAGGAGVRYLEEVRFPRIGRRFALTDHANLCFYYMCAAIATLVVTIAVFANDSKIDYILVNTSAIFPLLILVMYACAMYELFE
jgi:magnesium-transporting ATPase (P-type)